MGLAHSVTGLGASTYRRLYSTGLGEECCCSKGYVREKRRLARLCRRSVCLWGMRFTWLRCFWADCGAAGGLGLDLFALLALQADGSDRSVTLVRSGPPPRRRSPARHATLKQRADSPDGWALSGTVERVLDIT